MNARNLALLSLVLTAACAATAKAPAGAPAAPAARCGSLPLGCEALVDTQLRDATKAPAALAALARSCPGAPAAVPAEAAARDVCWAHATFLADGANVKADAPGARARLEALCAAGHARSCRGLGTLLFEGVGGKAEPARAQTTWREACDHGERRACAEYAQSWKRLGHTLTPADARERLEKACAAKDPHSCARLALVLFAEDGGEVAEARGEALARAACDGGSPLACQVWAQIIGMRGGAATPEEEAAQRRALTGACAAGVAWACEGPGSGARVAALCKAGDLDACTMTAASLADAKDPAARGVLARNCERSSAENCALLAITTAADPQTKDLAPALALARRACDLGSSAGCYFLSAAYYRGQGVPADDAAGDRVLDESCGRGVAMSCLYLASVREQDGDRSMVAAYERACAAGSGDGCMRAAELHHLARHDAKVALPFERRACALRVAAACARVAALAWEPGRGVDDDEGAHAAGRGCQLGSPEACFLTARFLGAGRGLVRNVEGSLRLHATACQRGWAPACAEVAYYRFATRGGGEAAKLAQHACEQGAARGCTLVAWMDLLGDGVVQDEDLAAQLFKHACSLGDDAACSEAKVLAASRATAAAGSPGRVPFARQSGSCEAAPWVEVPGGKTRMAWAVPGLSDAAEVTVAPFAMRVTEVSRCQYAACVKARKCPAPDAKQQGANDAAMAAVVGVAAEAAEAYCRFEGGRLPREAEWVFAAYGESPTMYPWGSSDPQCGQPGNACPSDGKVGAIGFDVSPFGVRDLVTGVAEWTSDWFGRWPAQASDPSGPVRGTSRVVRGGTLGALVARAARRPGEAAPDLGFRCVRPAGKAGAVKPQAKASVIAPAWYGGDVAAPSAPAAPAKLCPRVTRGAVIGDSIVQDLYLNAKNLLVAPGGEVTRIAAAGATVAQQLDAWKASPLRGKPGLDWVYVQAGINDVLHGDKAEASCKAMAELLADIRKQNPGTKIFFATMLPAKKKLELIPGPARYPVWRALDAMYVKLGASTLIAQALGDGKGNLRPEFDKGDGLHPNKAGDLESARVLRTMIDAAFPPQPCP